MLLSQLLDALTWRHRPFTCWLRGHVWRPDVCDPCYCSRCGRRGWPV